MAHITQNTRLIAYLEQNGSITQMESLAELGIYHLSSRISEIKKQGYNITGKMITVKNRFNENIRVKRYYYNKAPTKQQ